MHVELERTKRERRALEPATAGVIGRYGTSALTSASGRGREFEAILGAFFAGAIISLVDRDRAMTHPQFRQKLEAVGYGVFVPFFFVSTGVRFDLDALFASAETIARVPIFLAALLAARGLPALLYRPLATRTQTAAAALLQATSLSFLVVAGQIGVQLDLIRSATYAALVTAGLLSVVLFPLTALRLLGGAGRAEPERTEAA